MKFQILEIKEMIKKLENEIDNLDFPNKFYSSRSNSKKRINETFKKIHNKKYI